MKEFWIIPWAVGHVLLWLARRRSLHPKQIIHAPVNIKSSGIILPKIIRITGNNCFVEYIFV
jgi:hypothetical protein